MSQPIPGEALYQWRCWATQLAQANNIDPEEIDWLLQGVTTLTRLSLQLATYRQQPSVSCQFSLNQLTEKWQQRVIHRVPVQYLVGETPWRNFSITVSPDVLIPRPETELIIDLAKSLAPTSLTKGSSGEQAYTSHWADLGTGSGAIALGLADTFTEANIYAVDISKQALNIAQRNAIHNNLDHRITFHQGSWLAPLSSLKGKLTGIISNPPYIPSQTVLTLQPEVMKHEPHLALDGGPNGLSCIQTLVTEGANYLQPGGLWLTELMDGQAKAVTDLLQAQSSYTDISIHNDLSGIERFVSAYKAL